MRKLSNQPISVLLVLTVFAFTMFLTPAETRAAYHDHSDELPGMDGSEFTPYLIVGGLLVGGLLIYKLAKHSSDKSAKQPDVVEEPKADQEEDDAEKADSTETTEPSENLSLIDYGDLSKTRLNMYFDVDPQGSSVSESSALDFSNMTVKVGFRVSF
ncbi:MAG: hypothetical protein ACOYVF_12625 [Candidatus Zixiibacteriota bacterium]